jgi:Protein of unknown function (DUF4038)/Domain of unknown function (DUF5060)
MKTKHPAFPPLRTEANVPVEITMTAKADRADPFNEVTLDVIFVDPRGRELRVPAFWAGGRTWKARYASPLTGAHSFRSECSDGSDAGLHGLAGSVEVASYSGTNPLFTHGPLRMAANRRFLEHADGTPFFWLGDTWWMGLCSRLHWPGEFQRLAADRVAKGFNVVQIVAGLYPDMPAFDPRGANEAGFPWEENYARMRPEYYDAADQRLRHLVDQGIIPCLVGAWGYFMPWMGAEKLKTHWRYLIARYGAWPMVWCVAGEANLPWYLAKGFPWDDREQVREWTKVMRYVCETDPFQRLVTIHPTGLNFLSARNATDDAGLLDIDFLQTGHAGNEAVEPNIKTTRICYASSPTLPVINSEPCYEMLNDSITAEWPRRAFWSCVLNGAAGHTYGANGIWQCNRAEQAHGNSPWGGGYGKISWEQAMDLGGSRHVSLGKALLERHPWQNLRPHPEWASFDELKWLSLEGCRWIWSTTAQPAANEPNIRRYFRRSFTLDPGRTVVRARLRVAGESHIDLNLNGTAIGGAWGRQTGSQFDDRAGLLRPGRNVLSIWVEHRPPTGNPSGLIACLEVAYSDGQVLRVGTDDSWKLSESEVPGWQGVDFDDGAWKQAVVAGELGAQPWGPIGEPAPEFFGPQAAGVPGGVRIIYAPCALPITVRHLGERQAYRATYFDPVTGARTEIGTVVSSASGEWRCPPPAGLDHDWIALLEPATP